MKSYKVISNWLWGTLLLLAAAFVLANQFGGFINIGIGSIIVTVLALLFIVQCIANLSFSALPIPLAVLYYVFSEPLGFPFIKLWTLLLAAVLATIGLAVVLPHRRIRSDGTQSGKYKYKHYKYSKDHSVYSSEDEAGNDNNPSVSVKFGSVSRYLHSDCLETAHLYCNCGELEVFFDKAQLSPDGAVANCYCSLGSMTIFIPKHWHVIDELGCTLGGVEIDDRFAEPEENAPQLRIIGSVVLGAIEVRLV
jgi:hypothetical protein